MADVSNRTFVCSVLFLDIVEYSKRSVTEQMTLKQRFNAFLVTALQHVAPAERIILDTGDGAAISFQGNPEDALFAGMALRDEIAAEPNTETPPLLVRYGINLGPIRLIKDINGQLNIIGDGVNVAQRVMSFSAPGEILVSRSYYEVVSRLSDDYIRIFHEAGTRTDKHVREHEVYAIGETIHSPKFPAVKPATPDSAPVMPTPNAAASAAKTSVWWKRKPILFGVPAAIVAAIAASAMLHTGKPDVVPPTSSAQEEKKQGTETSSHNKPAADAQKKATPPAKVNIALVILPWGEVFVDGNSRGVSPPVKSLSLSPGKHTIEIRNSGFTPYVQQVEGKPGDKIEVKHKF